MICSQMIANQNQAVMFLADTPSASACSVLHLTHAGNKLTCLYSIACGLFGPIQKLKSSVFNNIRTLFEKHPGVGALSLPAHSFRRRLTSRRIRRSSQLLSPLESAFTPNAPVTPLECALTQNTRGW